MRLMSLVLFLHGFVLEEVLFELLVFDFFSAGFFGQLVGFVGLGGEALLAVAGLLEELVEQVAELTLAAAEEESWVCPFRAER